MNPFAHAIIAQVAALAAGGIVTAVLGALLAGAKATVKSLTDALEHERKVTEALHNRLASKSLAEFQAVTQPAPAPPASVEHISDPTGLISVEADNGPAA